MELNSKKWIIIRSALYLVIFILLHYAYDWFPNPVFAVFSGIDESVYQHMKIAFYAYIILIVIEFLIFRKKIERSQAYFFTRLFSTVIIPWIVFVLFFIGRALYPYEFPEIIEIIYALGITFLVGIVISFIELEFDEVEYSKRFQILLVILLIILIMEFTVFTFRLPWHDIFADPYA